MAASITLALSLALGAASPETWAVLAVEEAGAPGPEPTLEAFRGAVARELGARAEVLPADEVRRRMGLPAPGAAWIRERIDAAELYYFQLELRPARENLEQALEALENGGGDPAARDRERVARLLLGMVFLAEGGDGARERAVEQLAWIARVEPGYRPDPRSYPPEVLALFAEARALVASRPHGTLRVGCAGPCAEAQVWVDGFPAGVPGEALALPAGRYTIVVTDAFEKPSRRSRAHVAEVPAAAETELRVDLGAEAMDAAGPALVAAPGDEGAAASRASSWLGATAVALWSSGDGASRTLHVAVAQAGKVVRAGRAPAPAAREAEALAALARVATRSAVPEAVLAQVERPRSASRPWTVAAWSAAGVAVALGGIGTYLVADAGQRQSSLEGTIDREMRDGNAISDAPGKAREIHSIEGQKTAGGGLLLGAGVLAAGAITLYLVDRPGERAPPPSIGPAAMAFEF